MRRNLFLYVFVYSLIDVIFTKFSYVDELENGSFSQSNDNKVIENKLTNIFSYYKDLIHDKNIQLKDTELINKVKNEIGKIIPDSNNTSDQFSFIQKQEIDSDSKDNKLFIYQPFIMTQFHTKFTPPSPRRGHTTLIADTFLLVFGGCYQEIKCYNDLHFLDLRSQKWIEIPTLGKKPTPRGNHAAILYGTTLYIYGGNSVEGFLNDIFSIDLETREWKHEFLLGDSPITRTNIVGVKDDQGRMIVFGGYTENGYDNTIYILNFIDKVFEKPNVSGNMPTKRENYGMVYLNNRVWVFGGFQEGGVLNDLYSIDTFTWTWTIVETSGPKPPACQGMSMTRVGKKIYITGGCDVRKRKCFSDIYVLDTDSLWWTKIENNKSLMQPRESFTSVFFRGHLYSFGGCQLHQTCYNDVFIMNINDICPNKCSGKGVCKKEIGCACNLGFTEHDCSTKTKCIKDCSNHGICHNNAKCGCFPGFTGPYCDVNLNCPKNCTSLDNGICSNNGTCICRPGFSGPSCDQYTSNDVEFSSKTHRPSSMSFIKVPDSKINSKRDKYNSTMHKPFYQSKNKAKNNNKTILIKNSSSHSTKSRSSMNSIFLNTSQLIQQKVLTKSGSKNAIYSLAMNSTIPVFLQRENHGTIFFNLKATENQEIHLNSFKNFSRNLTNKIKRFSANPNPNLGDDDLAAPKKKLNLSANEFVTGADPDLIWTTSKDCPDNCNKKGLCLNNTCFCDQGYTFPDCSLTYKQFMRMGFKMEDMVFMLVVSFIGGFIWMVWHTINSRNKSNDEYLDLD